MRIRVSSLFPADKDKVFAELQQISTLQYICSPLATFEPLDERTIWEAGATFKLNLRAAGFDFGVHTINVLKADTERIQTQEGNRHIPVWNHEITLEDTGNGHTRYTDNVEIHAGAKTPFIWLWANLFYRHRQRKWRELL